MVRKPLFFRVVFFSSLLFGSGREELAEMIRLDVGQQLTIFFLLCHRGVWLAKRFVKAQ